MLLDPYYCILQHKNIRTMFVDTAQSRNIQAGRHQQNLNFGIDDGSFHREPIESALPHSYAQISETVQSYLEP